MQKDCVIRLKDGRRLGVAQYGDPEGKPIFFFHGWPGSRLLLKQYHQIAKKINARIISFDRPGYGLSDFKPRRRLLDWPDDMVEVADALNIKKFAVIGVSGGGPYAAACAYKIPDRLTKAGIVVGLGPMHIKGAFKGVSWTSKIGWDSDRRRPILLKIVPLIILIQTKLLAGKFEKMGMSRQERKAFSKELRKELRANRLEAVVQGAKGLAHDLKLYTSSWGFSPSKIRTKVHLWYGDSDRNISLNMGKYYAASIPGSTFTIYPKEGHFLLNKHSEEIFRELVI